MDLPAYSWGTARTTRDFPLEVLAVAACEGLHEVMFPDLWPAGNKARAPYLEMALALCETCPGLAPCRDWSLEQVPNAIPVGIYGGLTPSDRAEHYRIVSE